MGSIPNQSVRLLLARNMILTQLQVPKQHDSICILPRLRVLRLWKRPLVIVDQERVKYASSMVMKYMLAHRDAS